MTRSRGAIVGVGASPQGKLPDETPLSLAVTALRLALEDAGLGKDDLDGLLTMPGTTSPEGAKHYLALGGALGINPNLTGSMSMGGATAGALIEQAALATEAGLADVVACVFADTARTGGSRFDAAAGRGDSWGIWGMFGNAANSALTAQRHMALYGTTSEHLGWVAITCRKHASLNPAAVMQEPMTLRDHQSSRSIVDPLRKLDCCLISDGAVAVIVTSPERARACRKPPANPRDGPGAHPADVRASRMVVPASSTRLHLARVPDGRRQPPGNRRRAALRQLHDLGAAVARARRFLCPRRVRPLRRGR